MNSTRRAWLACILAGATGLATLPAHAQPGMSVMSSDFSANGVIPTVHEGNGAGCTGENVPLSLSWTGVPPHARSLALTMVDYTAPVVGGFAHWVVSYIPPSWAAIDGSTVAGTFQGINSLGTTGYFGPCPPPGQLHDYTITLYALDTSLHSRSMTLSTLQAAIKTHVLAQTSTVGTFER